MNIYKETKVITHEEVIQISKHYNLNINQSSTIEKYALQQQAKEERAKKVEELLGLYQGLRKTKSVFHVASIFENAKALEKELEEMK